MCIQTQDGQDAQGEALMLLQGWREEAHAHNAVRGLEGTEDDLGGQESVQVSSRPQDRGVHEGVNSRGKDVCQGGQRTQSSGSWYRRASELDGRDMSSVSLGDSSSMSVLKTTRMTTACSSSGTKIDTGHPQGVQSCVPVHSRASEG